MRWLASLLATLALAGCGASDDRMAGCPTITDYEQDTRVACRLPESTRRALHRAYMLEFYALEIKGGVYNEGAVRRVARRFGVTEGEAAASRDEGFIRDWPLPPRKEETRTQPARTEQRRPSPSYVERTATQPRWAYWRGYEWCRLYRELGYGPADEVGGDFYHDTGDSSTFDAASKGCDDGYERRAPAVPRPMGFELEEEPNDFEEEE
jgi:hypothetical protein